MCSMLMTVSVRLNVGYMIRLHYPSSLAVQDYYDAIGIV